MPEESKQPKPEAQSNIEEETRSQKESGGNRALPGPHLQKTQPLSTG